MIYNMSLTDKIHEIKLQIETAEKEIESLISLAKQGLVDVAAVGNEVLHRDEISQQELKKFSTKKILGLRKFFSIQKVEKKCNPT